MNASQKLELPQSIKLSNSFETSHSSINTGNNYMSCLGMKKIFGFCLLKNENKNCQTMEKVLNFFFLLINNKIY